MMNRTALAMLIFCFSVFAYADGGSGKDVPWAKNLCFDGGGVWTLRLPVMIANDSDSPMEGAPVKIRFADTLAMPRVNEIRVTRADGQEVVFSAFSGNGERLVDGPLPRDGFLMIPVDCESGAKANYFVYYGNEKAENVPDSLDVKAGFVNGDLELGDGSFPVGWQADANKEARRNSWVDEKPHTGKKCLKTEIEDGETPSWFAVRQSGIPVVGGGKYRFSAWVRGENVTGRAGWFLHVGNEQKSDRINNVQGNYEGTFDWKEIKIEFTAPDDANRATVGTVLYGTGTAWFDSVSFECLDRKSDVGNVFGELDFIPYKVYPADPSWPTVEPNDYLCRSSFRIVNDSEKPLKNVPVLMTLRGTLAHGLSGSLTDLFVVTGTGEERKKTPARLIDTDNSRAVANIDIPAKTIKYFNVYYQFDESRAPQESTSQESAPKDSPNPERNLDADTAHPEFQIAVDPFAGLPNLLKNDGFEAEPLPDGFPGHWRRNESNPPAGIRYSLETDPKIVRFGNRCTKLEVSEQAPENWRGWTQRVDVEPGKSYLVQGWIKTLGGSARIHLHFHDTQGAHTKNDAMTSVGPDVSGDWVRLAEVVTTPPDARFMTIHLTTNSSGTFWHDNISVFDGLFAEQVDRESFLRCKDDRIPSVWPVHAVTKVFPQTIPSPKTGREKERNAPFKIEAARNEKEPLQLALRSGVAQTVRVDVAVPKNKNGIELNDFEINIVGYVPVDYPSNYYNAKTPRWYRKTPASAPGCDGWKGLWPDPLLLRNTIDLKPNRTESVWVTWSIPKEAPPGKYLGAVNIEAIDGSSTSGYPVEITVRNFTLPDETHVTAMYDIRFGPGSKYWGRSLGDYYKEIAELMSENRLAPDTVGVEPKVEYKDGRFVFDWTKYDEACRLFFNERKFRVSYAPMNLFYIFGWGHPPKNFFGEKPYEGEWPFTGADFTKLRPEYKAKYQACLRAFWEHVKEKGWAERFVLYISDEPNYWQGTHLIDQMKAVCEMIHEVDPAIPIYSSTWRHVPDWDRSLDIWGIGHYGIVPVDTMERIKKNGSKIWFTTDGMLCLDTPYSAIERLLPYYCFKYGADAYEFWGVGWLTYDPYRYGSHAFIYQTSTPGEHYWVRYPNGDGYLIYPPGPVGAKKIVPSIRFAQAREGVEDFEYFYLLENLIEKAKTNGRDVSKAEAALRAATDLVDCPSPIGRYSSKILPNPQQLYDVRRRVADAIESLQQGD